MHTPGAQIDRTMHPVVFSYAHFYVKVFIMWRTKKCAKIDAPGSQNVHTGCRVHP